VVFHNELRRRIWSQKQNMQLNVCGFSGKKSAGNFPTAGERHGMTRHLNTHIHIHIQTNTHTHTDTNKHKNTNTYRHKQTQKHIQTQTNTHMHDFVIHKHYQRHSLFNFKKTFFMDLRGWGVVNVNFSDNS
jgi:hypothetical protein